MNLEYRYILYSLKVTQMELGIQKNNNFIK